MRRLSFEEVVEGDYFSRVTLEPPPHHRRSFHRNPSSLTSVLSFVNSRKSFSYEKLADFPIQLTIIKLDGSSFEIEVTKRATIAELKQAVQNYFSYLPTEGPDKISWQQVWGHFCLTYGGKKLLNDGESIKVYGIKDGDELHFVRHVLADMLIKKRSKKYTSNTYTMLPILPLHFSFLRVFRAFDCAVILPKLTWDFTSFRIENEEEDLHKENEDSDDLEDLTCLQLKHKADDNPSNHELDICYLFKGWFKYSRISSMDSPGTEGTTSSRRWGGGFVGFLRNIFHFCGNRRPAYSSRVSQVEI